MTFTRVAWLLALVLVLLGALFLVYGVRTVRADRRHCRTWRPYPGEVVASVPDGEQTRCQVGYRRADGTRVLFWNSFTSTVMGDPVGRPVQVLENPDDPREAVVASGIVGGNLVGTVFVVVGAVFGAAGVVVLAVLVRP